MKPGPLSENVSTPREMVDKLHAGQPGWFACRGCGSWYTANGLEKHEQKCPGIEKRSPYDVECLTCRLLR